MVSNKNNQDWERSNYFDYSEGSAQSLDFSVLLDFSDKGVPLDFQWNTFIVGADYNYDENGNPTTRAFSSYAEVGYTKIFENINVAIRPFVGVTIMEMIQMEVLDFPFQMLVLISLMKSKFLKIIISLYLFGIPITIMVFKSLIQTAI